MFEPRQLIPVIVLTLASTLLGRPACAQQVASSEVTGRVSGVVFDSTRAQPLEAAKVVLWETAFTAETDAEGWFEIEDVPPGRYSVVFFHPRLQYLGIGSGQVFVEVAEGQESPVTLVTPSMPTILSTECLLEPTQDGHGIALGHVADSRSGVAMAGAQVTFRWLDPSGRLGTATAAADPEGWYRACSVPKGVQMSGRASFLNMSSTRREVSLAEESAVRADFLLGDYSDSQVSGTLVDQLSGQPVQGAEVRLEGTDYFTTSDAQGRFHIPDVEPGEYTLSVAHLAFPTRRERIDFQSDLGHHLQIAMAAEAIELDPIVVTVEREELSRHIAMGGQLITAADVEKVRTRSTNLADVLQLQRVSGLLVRRIQGQLCAEFSSGTVRLMQVRACESVMLYIDGAKASDPTVAMDLPADAIDHIVIFRPVEAGALFGTGSAHGVIMIYTKNGTRRR